MKRAFENSTGDRTDVLIIGAGIAGLSLAIKVAAHFPEGEITLISKDKPGESNTRYAQGGIAAVIDRVNDSFEQHILDTITAGAGLCSHKVVEGVVKEAPERLNELVAWGADFDRDDSGKLLLGLEGGHSAHRIVHTKDETGFAVVRTLIHKLESLKNVHIVWNTLAVDLLIGECGQTKVCKGATYLNTRNKQIKSIQASFVVLATGGIGQLYPLTTNPPLATGDGIAMAYRAGASISHMAYIQFHPTALNIQHEDVSFLITEALRGFGARLITEDGHPFMTDYDERGDLAPRDIVARVVYLESQRQLVFLDCRHLSAASVKKEFPKIYDTCLSYGIDITRDKIPVKPAAHYLCGGIVTDAKARTSINNLYAIGECACTGLHGANRLASNSLLEALVFSHRCYANICERWSSQKPASTIAITNTGYQQIDENQIRSIRFSLKECMASSAGIVRSNESLQYGLDSLQKSFVTLENMVNDSQPNWLLYETRNMLQVGILILQQCMAQTENRGAHFNSDMEKVKQEMIVAL